MEKVKSKNTEKRDNNVVRPIYFISFIVMLILLSIAYASLATMLGVKVNGQKKIESLNWRIEWDNIQEHAGSVKPISKATIDGEKTTITYSVALAKPGDYYAFDADMVNRGTIDAKINEIINRGMSDDQKRYIDYTIKYKDGTEPSIDDKLDASERRTVTVIVKYKEDLNQNDLPAYDQTLNLTYQIIYVEK